jgi:predicted phage tail protein
MSIKITLHGDLEDFGKTWELDVHSPAEAVRAIDVNSPGFLDRLQSGSYAIMVAPRDEEVTHEDQVRFVSDDTLELPVSDKEVMHFIPVAEGDALTAAAWVYFAIGSSGIAGATVIAAVAAVAVFAAITFAMITIADMLMPTPPGIDNVKSDPSHAFSGPVNLSKQGGVVPVLYGGPLLVGSQVIGHSIITEDLSALRKDDGDTFWKMKSQAYAEIVEVISEGEIEGFAGADLESSVYFDGVPARVGLNDQFEGFKVSYVKGTASQTASDLHIATNPSATSVHLVNALVQQDRGPLVRLTQDQNVGSVTFTIHFPALYKTRSSSTTVRPRGVTFAFRIKGVGQANYVLLEELALKGKARDGFYKDYTYSINPAQHGDPPYFLQVERISPDSDDTSIFDELYWNAWSEHVKSNLAYPYSAYAVTNLDAEFFSSLPTRGFLMKGLKVRIPSNYDPIARTYNGSWNGEWYGPPGNPTLTWTNNPAWIFYDLATHPRYGLGQYMDDTLIDKWVLYSIAMYCDQLVDDGYNGQEPRFVCNMYLQNSGEALTVLRDLASSFRSIMFWAGQLKVHQDSPSPVRAQFTPSNVIGGSFSYSGTPKHLRTTVALVTWNNPDDNYNAWIEYVEDEEGIRLYGINESSITAVGCTSRGQAHRVGKYALLMNRLLTDSCTFKVGMDGAQSLPGHVVKVVDPIHNQSGEHVGGRLASVTNATTVVLDRTVTLEGGESYHLTVTMPDDQADGLLQSAHAVTNGAGQVVPPSTITLATPMPSTPVEGAVWTLSKDSESERLYRLLTVTDQDTKDGGFYELSGVRYIPSALTDADDPGKLEPPDVPDNNVGISPPSYLRMEDKIRVTTEGNLSRYIECEWGAPVTGFLHHYKITVEHEYGPDIVVDLNDPYYEIPDVQEGVYNVYVRAVNVAGQISTALFASLTLDELAPIDLLSITGLELFGQGNDNAFTGQNAEFTWRLTSALTGDLGDETFGGDTGITDPWFNDYEISMYDQYGNLLRVDHTTERSYTYGFDKNLEDGGPRRVFEIGVTARDKYNRKTDEVFLSVYNPPPVGFTNVVITPGLELIVVRFTPPEDNDYVRTRIYVSELDQFTPSEANLAYEGNDLSAYIGNLPNFQYYVKLEGVDAFGPAEVYSQQYDVYLQTVNRIQDAVAGQIQEGWLYKALQDRIDLIDNPVDGLLDRVIENEAAIAAFEQSNFVSLQTFYQDTDPQLNNPAPVLSEGDLWIDTSSGDTIKRWNGNAWDALESGGNQVFYGDGPPRNPFTGQSPDPQTLVTGDYWIDTHVYDVNVGPANTPWMWDGSDWVNVSEGLLQATASTLDYVVSQVTDPATNASGLSAYIDSVESRVSISEGEISANTSQITTLVSEITDPDAGTSAMALYLQDLNFQVYDNSGLMAANAEATTTLQATVETKVTTYRQSTDPALNVPAPTLVDGDIWYKTDEQMHPYRYQAAPPAGWKDVRDASVTGTSTWIGTGPPDPNDPKYTTGDLYYQEDDNFKPFRFNGTVPEWESVRDTASSGITTNVGAGHPDDTGDYNTGDLYFDSLDNNHPYRYEVNQWVSMLGAAGIHTYYQGTPPSGGTYAEGDLWFNTSDGNRVHVYDGVTPWLDIQDAEIASALSAAQAAQNQADLAQATADGKIVTFYQDSPPSGVGESDGDFWINTTLSGGLPLNTLNRYNTNQWVAVQDKEVQDALTAAGDAQSTADGKIVTFYQPDPPNDTVSSDGDLWFDTDDNHPYRYDPTANPKWQSIKDLSPAGLNNYFGPTPPSGGTYLDGDLWFDTSDDNHPHIYDSGSNPVWQSIKDTSVAGVDTFYQDSPPTNGMVIGDLWFETDANNAVYRFTGSKGGWDLVEDGDFSGVIPWVQPNQPNPPIKYVGDLWIDTDDGNRVYEWQGGPTWVDMTQYYLDHPDTVRTTAAVAVEQSARIQQDGLAFAEYSIKVDVNGHIAGIGLGVSGGASGPIRSQVIVLADQFAVGYPTMEYQAPFYYTLGLWVTPSQAWIDANGDLNTHPDGEQYYTWDYVYKVTTAGNITGSGEPTWITGVGSEQVYGARFKCYLKTSTLPFIIGEYNRGTPANPIWEEGVIMSSALIGRASIDRAMIKDAEIVDAKILSLTADKITTGTLKANQWIRVGDDTLTLDANDRRMTVLDNNNYDRVEIGLLSTGDYGLLMRDAANAVVFSADGLNGTFIEDASITSAKIGSLEVDKLSGDVFEVDIGNATPNGGTYTDSSYSSGTWIAYTFSNTQGWWNCYRLIITAQSFDRVLHMDPLTFRATITSISPYTANNVVGYMEIQLYDNGVYKTGNSYSRDIGSVAPGSLIRFDRDHRVINYTLTKNVSHSLYFRMRARFTYGSNGSVTATCAATSPAVRVEHAKAPQVSGITWSTPGTGNPV